MIVVSQVRGMGNMEIQAPYSRTNIFPPNRARVAAARRAAGGWSQVQALNGLGQLPAGIPSWAPWLVGGLAVGGAAGFLYFRKRK